MTTIKHSAWNKVTNKNSLFFEQQVYVMDQQIFPPKDDQHVTVMTADDAPLRQLKKTDFLN